MKMESPAEIRAMFDFIFARYEYGGHIDEVHKVVNENLEAFLSIGCKPRTLAMMMDSVDVLRHAENFKCIDINPIALQLSPADIDLFFDQLIELGVKADFIREAVVEWDNEKIIERSKKLQKCGFSKKEISELLHNKNTENDWDNP